jgi:hypothetical protein
MFRRGPGKPHPCPRDPISTNFMNMKLRFMNTKLRFVNIKLDELVKSPKTVIPAKAGIYK